MHDVFIAHVADDADVALRIASGLEKAGYTTWTYEMDGIPGFSYLLQTRKAIRESRSALIIVSPQSVGSWQVNNELIFTHESGKDLIVILCGITHLQFQDRHPEYREAIGTATPVAVPLEEVSVVLPDIINELQSRGVHGSLTTDAVRIGQMHRALIGLQGRAGAEHDVYISCSPKDKDFARMLHDALEARKLDTWNAQDDLRPSANWVGQVYEAIESAGTFVFIVSRSSASSEFCHWELAHAIKNHKRVIPIALHDIELEALPRPVASLAFLKWSFFREQDDFQQSFEELLQDIQTEPLEVMHSEEQGILPPRKAESKRSAEMASAPAETPESKRLTVRRLPTITPEVPGGRVDRVQFSVTSPPMIQPGYSFTVGIWAHLEKQRQEVVRRAEEAAHEGEISVTSQGPVKVERGTVLTVRLELEGFIVAPAEAAILWEGKIGNATFGVKTTGDAEIGPRVGTAAIRKNGLQIAVIHFELHVGKESRRIKQIKAKVKRHRKAFASYARADRKDVMLVIMGLQKGLPDLDVFVDVDSLRSREDWRKRIRKEIQSRDIFYLFWSGNAEKSDWVEREWRWALRKPGLSFIDPCPLVDPRVVKPPKELARLHFYDRWLAYRSTKAPESADSSNESIEAGQ